MDTCKICGATSEEKAFYARVNTRCADCHKAKVRQNRKEKADYYREYDAKRFKDDPRVRIRHEAYKKTEAGKKSLLASRQKWLENNSEKRAAHVILGNRLKNGKIAKPSKCENCGMENRKIHGHHHDYSKPLDVKWLCPKCHALEHKRMKECPAAIKTPVNARPC